ncbi:MAG: hypothetical protein HUJ63_03440 [Enterococcus sp.]|nr:hypothetical protein [Enterococcus sp.]
MLNQVTVFLENREGRFAAALRVLAEHNINMHALTVADTDDYGVARLIVDKPKEAVEAFRAHKYLAKLTPTIMIALKNEVGSTLELLDALQDKNMNIEYAYAFSASEELSYLVLRTNYPETEEFIKSIGYETLNHEDYFC